MTLGNFLSQMGIGPKHLTERFSHGGDYGGGSHDSHLIYSYEPSHSSHQHVATSKHHYGGGGKSNTAMSALTLLAFLFFLHILQQCLRDHMMAMSTTPPVVIMTAGREGEEPIPKTSIDKIDKAGKSEAKNTRLDDEKNENIETKHEKDFLMKINTAEHTPKSGAPKYTRVFKNYGNRSLDYRGFVNAMDGDYN